MWTRIDRPFSIPSEVRAVVTVLLGAGFEAYLVGGCVRDFLLGRNIKDYDVATSARPEDVERLFPKVLEIGRAFGVMKVVCENAREIEVATFRTESDYKDHRHPSKVEFGTAEGDSARRDFTINALYFDLKTSQVLDFHGGLDDLKSKIIRAIGNPNLRFEEDALRLMRAVRFSTRLGFQIEPSTRAAIQENAPLIRKISIERVRDELEKMITHKTAKVAVLELDALHLFENVMPEISVAKLVQRKVWDQTLRVLSVLGAYEIEEPASFHWALFFLPTLRLLSVEKRDAEARKIASRLKLSNSCADEMAYLVRETPKFSFAFTMREATLIRWMKEEWFELLMRFHALDAISYDGNQAGLEFVSALYPEMKKRFGLKPLITGEDLVKMGLSPGRQFTEILRAIEDLTLEGGLTSTSDALDYVLKHFVK
jgi:poly(A) polymerase